MKTKWLLMLGLAVIAQPLLAASIFSSFGSNDTVNSTTGLGILWHFDEPGSSANAANGAAAKFRIEGASYALSSVTLALGNDLGVLGTNNLVVSLVADIGGQPTGLMLEALTMHPTNIGNDPAPQIVTYSSSLQPILLQGNAYWLLVQPVDLDLATQANNGSFGWYGGNGPGTYAIRDFSFVNSAWRSWRVVDSLFLPAFRIEGTPVPEPGVVWLFVVGVGVLRLRWSFAQRR